MTPCIHLRRNSRFQMPVTFVAWMVVAVGVVGHAEAQPDLESSPGPFTFQATLPAGPMRVVGDTGLILGDGIVHVYERDPATDAWTETATLIPSDGGSGFGKSLDFDGTRALVGADGAAYLFRRSPGVPPRWREVTKLQPGDRNPTFGRDVALDRDSILVSGPSFEDAGSGGGVYVFNRFPGRGWQEVKRLTSPDATNRFFGTAISLDKGTAAIAKSLGGGSAVVYIFDRHEGGPDNWAFVKRIPGFVTFRNLAIDGDTLMIGWGESYARIRIFERNAGGPNAWGEVAGYAPFPPDAAGVPTLALDGDRVIFSSQYFTDVVVLSRNQGGRNAWGAIARFGLPFSSRFRLHGSHVSGDTISFIYAQRGDPQEESTLVYVSDEDGDGVRDGLDQCPRDPLNNVDGGCLRATAAYPVLDHLVTQTSISTSSPSPGRLVVTITYTNTSPVGVRNPFFDVTEISGRSTLLNGDSDFGGVGATLSPDVGDGVLSPGESVTADFVIRRRPLAAGVSFHVTFKGEPVQ